MHEIDPNNVVVELCDHIHRMREFSALDPEVHLVDPDRVLFSRSGHTALSI
jgi:hypothetical protein